MASDKLITRMATWPRMTAAVVVLLTIVVAVRLSIGRGGRQQAGPTADLSVVSTDAVATIKVELTRTALAAPTLTSTSATIPTAATAFSGTGSVTPLCLGLRYLRDVTIPDNTEMPPAQVFTKTWLVENSGACLWEPGFEVVMVGGMAMGGSPFKLAQRVGPGGTIQISIKMVTPTTQTGVVQGTWKMSDAKGTSFGDYLSVVVVVSGGKPTPTHATPIATP